MSMTTVKVKFRPSTVEDRPGTIVYFVTHRRAVRQITTDYKVFPHEWDNKQSRPILAPTGERTTVIQTIAQRIRRDINRLDKIINSLNCNKREFATDEIVKLFHERNGKHPFSSLWRRSFFNWNDWEKNGLRKITRQPLIASNAFGTGTTSC